MTATVPEDKVRKTVAAADSALGCEWVALKQIWSLLGLLGFCGQVLVSGGWRVPWTVGALRAAAKMGFAPMHEEWQTELLWWKGLLTKWNRVALLVPEVWKDSGLEDWQSPFTDTSRALGLDGEVRGGGAGAVFGKYAMHFKFTDEEITWLPICDTGGLVLVLWLYWVCDNHPGAISGTRFRVWCDNQSFTKAVNARRSNAPTLAFLLGLLHDLQARFSFDVRIDYVKSEENVAADAASRGDWDRFYSHMQTVGFTPSDVVWVPVQEARRSSWSYKLRSLRILQGRLTDRQKLE